MTIIELLIIMANGFLYFLMAVGAITLFFPVRMSIHPPSGILFGIAVTSSYWNQEETDIKYIFFQAHLGLMSLGIFINLGYK